MITVVVGKEIEKIKGDFESYLNGLNMVGEISYSQYSELYDEGTKQIQRAYELGRAELEKENAELRNNGFTVSAMTEQQLKVAIEKGEQLEKENAKLKKRVDNLYNSDCWASDQLTKAKEIIKNLMEFAEIDCREYEEAYKEAEQFISEVEE